MSETNVTIYEDREFMIFNVSELNLVDFTKVHETSAETVRKSVDGTKTFCKWDGATPLTSSKVGITFPAGIELAKPSKFLNKK